MCLHIYRGMKILQSLTRILNLRGFFPLDSAVISQRDLPLFATYTHILTSSRRLAYTKILTLCSTQNTHEASFLLIPLSYHRGERNNLLLRAIEKQSLTLARRRGLACTESVNSNQYTRRHQRWGRDHASTTPKTKM